MSDEKTKNTDDRVIIPSREKTEHIANENFSRKNNGQDHLIIRSEESWPKPSDTEKKK